jgi:hypothetical protein
MLKMIGFWCIDAREIAGQKAVLRAELCSPHIKLTPEERARHEALIAMEDPYLHPEVLIDPDWEREDRPRLVAYLRSGASIMEYLGYSYCRFLCGAPGREMGGSELSDGVWLWPEGLAHYVEEHLIRLPGELVEHARRNNFQIPPRLSAWEPFPREGGSGARRTASSPPRSTRRPRSSSRIG